ncbi:MAG: peptidoglycan bridge formation glycyltransferase FemA/FemB family protein [Oscillospiraceae bacterium]|nr:peptidoglycan bridge formation glycyltransferase FemA/FemB family protein [Oscillospiraceae bacterium]
MDIKNDWYALPENLRKRLKEANVFFSEDWYAYNKNRNEEMYYFWDESYLMAVRIKKVFILKGGVLDAEPFCLGNDDSFQKQQLFLDKCCRLIKQKRLADWIQTEICSNFLSYPSTAVVFGSGNYMLTLENCTDEELLQKMHSKNRNLIRRGMREGITISHSGDHLLADYKYVEDQVWARQGKPLRSMEHFRDIVKCMPKTSSVAVAYNTDGEPEAGVVFLFTKVMGYYHHGASGTNHVVGAHNYLLFKQCCFLKDLGVKKVCFVGYRRESELGRNAKSDSIQKYKEKFSDEVLETYGFKVEFNKFHFKLYRLANMIINKEQFEDKYDSRSKNYPEYNTRKHQ